MKNILVVMCCALVIAANPAHAADKIVLQLKWLHQAQFAGYYVAQENGYYADEDLEVEIRPSGPNLVPSQVVAAGAADVMVGWMPGALLAREQGIPLVNIAQPFKNSGYSLACKRTSNIKNLTDLSAKKVAITPGENGLPFRILMHQLGMTDDKTEFKRFVEVITSVNKLYAIQQRDADCVTVMSYNEARLLLEDGGFHKNELVFFRFQNLAVATLEDGLWVLEARLNDKKFSESMARFVRASIRGWRRAEENQEEAVQIVLQVMGDGADEEHQRFMMREIAKLTAGSNGALDIAEYERTAAIMLDGGILTAPPQGAWTSDITDKAQIYDRAD